MLENQAADGASVGALSTLQGVVEHAAEPHWIDAIFPVFAFLMVIVLPLAIAGWVIYKTLREKNCDEDEA